MATKSDKPVTGNLAAVAAACNRFVAWIEERFPLTELWV